MFLIHYVRSWGICVQRMAQDVLHNTFKTLFLWHAGVNVLSSLLIFLDHGGVCPKIALKCLTDSLEMCIVLSIFSVLIDLPLFF